jgi:hypothetical protein
MPNLHDAFTELAAAYARDTMQSDPDVARRLGQRQRRRRGRQALMVVLILMAGVGGHDVIGGLGSTPRPMSPPATTISKPLVLSLAQLRKGMPDLSRALDRSDASFQPTGPAVVVPGTFDGLHWRFVVVKGRHRDLPSAGCYLGGHLKVCSSRTSMNVAFHQIPIMQTEMTPEAAAWYGVAPTGAVRVRLQDLDGRPRVVLNTIDVSPVSTGNQFLVGRIWIWFSRPDDAIRGIEFLDADGRVISHAP